MRGWLTKIRRDKQLTQFEVAIKANISESYYSLIESGARNPSTKIAKRIADVLEFDWVKFYEGYD